MFIIIIYYYVWVENETEVPLHFLIKRGNIAQISINKFAFSLNVSIEIDFRPSRMYCILALTIFILELRWFYTCI